MINEEGPTKKNKFQDPPAVGVLVLTCDYIIYIVKMHIFKKTESSSLLPGTYQTNGWNSNNVLGRVY